MLLCKIFIRKFSNISQPIFSNCRPNSRLLLKIHAPIISTIHRNNSSQAEVEVYVGPLSKQIRSVKLFSLITSMSGLFAQPFILQRAEELQASSASIAAVCGVVGFFTLVTPLLLHAVTKKYVTSVVYNNNDDAYTATIYTLFLRKKLIHFKPGEAEIPDVPGMFTAITVRGVPLFIDSRFFTDIDHYKKIMGYDKPMDFKLKEKTAER